MTNVDYRQRIIDIATAELGSPGKERIREYHVSALGESVAKRVTKELEWCGLFCLWVLREAGLACDTHWRLGGGFCEELGLPRTKSPQPGDIAYFHRPFQHHALVWAYYQQVSDSGLADGEWRLSTIDGNQANDTIVARIRKPKEATVFYSIEPLIRAAESKEPERV